MNRLVKVVLILAATSSFALSAQSVRSDWTSHQSATQDPPPATTQDPPPAPVKVMREYKGVKLGMTREQVHTALGKPEITSENTDDYKLTGNDTMTVHYDKGEVKAIQLAFFDPKNAPAWKDVVGETAEVTQLDNGAKHARTMVSEEKFWVSIYQSRDGSTTQITISRQ
jgi:hypothetical protein